MSTTPTNRRRHQKTARSQRKKEKSTEGAFRSDPQYAHNYDAEEQSDIYGGKTAVEPPRPLLEIGREQYTSGIYDESSTVFGKLNPLLPGLSVYGDWRTAIAYNRNNGKDIAQVATRLNLDVDFKITATERIHAFFTPFQDGNAKFTRFEFGGRDGDRKVQRRTRLRTADPVFRRRCRLDLFGSHGAVRGIRPALHGRSLSAVPAERHLGQRRNSWRRGDAACAEFGGAWSLKLRHHRSSPPSTTSTTPASSKPNGKVDNDNANLFGVTTFIDAFNGYIEAGYGFLQGTGRSGRRGAALSDGRLYPALRQHDFKFDPRVRELRRGGRGNGDGVALISENSLITPLPSTLLPYANFFVGVGNPEPLVDGNNAGILKNVGINFETDALTGYPKLDDTASNTFGGALGLQYLFNLDQQLVFEVATVQPFET